jgi:hypothetical protein
MSGKLSEEQLRRCRARAKANNSSVYQEVFLEAGGRLKDWYESGTHRPVMFGFPADGTDAEMAEFACTEVARSRAFAAALEYRGREPKGGATPDEDACARVIAGRLTLAVMTRLGRPLKDREAHALGLAAAYIAMGPSAPEQVALEATAIERAIELANGG